MSRNVIHLPRPRTQRPGPEGLGFYVRAGRNDHVALLDLLATGEDRIFGLVIDAQHADRHRELITEARRSAKYRTTWRKERRFRSETMPWPSACTASRGR